MNEIEERKRRTLEMLADCEESIGKMRAEVEGGGKLTFISMLALTESTYISLATSFGPAGAAAHGLHLRTHADKLCERAAQRARVLEEMEPKE